ncbi:MAG: signal peptidase I [Armatimonadetes bacterium]|nr:signal peptidase I [Armatimonadota bacterium]
MTERLANLSWQSVLVIVAVLLLLRFSLIKLENEYAKTIAEVAESLAIAMALVFFLIRPFFVQAFFIPSGSMHPTLMEDDHILVNKLIYRLWQPKRGDVVVFKAPPEADQTGRNEEKDYIKRLMGLPGDTIEVRSGRLMVGADGMNHQRVEQDLIMKGILDMPPDEMHENHVKFFKDYVLARGWHREGGKWERFSKKLTVQELANMYDVKPTDIKIEPGETIRNGKVLNEPYTAEDPDYDLGAVKIEPNHLWVMGDNRNNSNDSTKWGQLQRKRLLGKAMFVFWPLTRLRLVH